MPIKNRNAGFTLTEVVMASVLLLVAMVPILKGLTASHLGSVIIEHRTRSLAFAQTKLEEIKARSIYSYASSFTESGTSLEGDYLCNVSDRPVGSNLRSITVSVGYDDSGNGTLSGNEILVSLNTLLAKRW